MLYQIARELETALKAQHVPFPVVFGPQPSDDLYAGRERIVIDHRGPGGDSFGPPKSQHLNPKMPLIRQQGARIRIYARSPLSGAAWHDHAERAEQVLDHVLAELDAIVRHRKNTLTFGAGGFIEPEDAAGTETQAGAVYEFEVAIDRGVFRRTWEGDKRPEVTVGGTGGISITSTTKASTKLPPAGTPPVGAETAC